MKAVIAQIRSAALGALTLLLAIAGGGPAHATFFSFYYQLESGSVLSGMMEGTIQSDGDTVEVLTVTMAALDDLPGPALVHVQSFLGFLDEMPAPARVSLSGLVMDIFASTEADGGDGFFFVTPPDDDPQYSAGASYGDTLELFDRGYWYLVDKNELPEATSTLALLALLLPSLWLARRRV